MHPNPRATCNYQDPGSIAPIQNLISTGFVALIIVIVIWIAYMFRKHKSKDELGFLSHFSLLGTVSLILVLCYGGLSIIYPLDPAAPGILLGMIPSAGFCFAVYCIITRPLVVYFQRYRSSNRVQPFDSSKFSTLAAVLQHPVSRERFSRFVVSEFSSGQWFLFFSSFDFRRCSHTRSAAENLIFFWRCEEFKLLVDPTYPGFLARPEMVARNQQSSNSVVMHSTRAPESQVLNSVGIHTVSPASTTSAASLDIEAIARSAFDVWFSFVSHSAQLQVNLSSVNLAPLYQFFALRSNLSGSNQSVPLPAVEAQANSLTFDAFVSWCWQQPQAELLTALNRLFDAAQLEIYRLMEIDSFQRFLRSPAFASMCNDMSLASQAGNNPGSSMLSHRQQSSMVAGSIA